MLSKAGSSSLLVSMSWVKAQPAQIRPAAHIDMILLLIFCNRILLSALYSVSLHDSVVVALHDSCSVFVRLSQRGVVYINKSDENDCYVEMFFYTSMYQVHYHIVFTKQDYKGFSQQIYYTEPYGIEEAKQEVPRFFEGKRDVIPMQSGADMKYVNLALELLEESRFQD